MKEGDAVRFWAEGGSLGLIEAANHYGGFYVRWYYGRDVKGEYMTGLSSVRPEQLKPITLEELDAHRNRFGFGDEPPLATREGAPKTEGDGNG